MNQINFNDIRISPIDIIPKLSEKDIRVIIIEVIHAYLEKKILLRTVAEIAELIRKYNVSLLSLDLKNDLDELSLMYVEEEVLTDILVELARDNC